MHSKEWPLIVFTIAAQLAAGVFVLLWGFQAQLALIGSLNWANQFTGVMLGIILAVLIVGVLGAALHLGNPRNMIRALTNWRTSWLSREMFLGGLFGGFVGLLALLVWYDLGSGAVRFLIGGIGSLAGLVLVFGIAKLYMLRTVPAWNTAVTPVTFFATTALLGSMVIGVGLVITAVSPPTPIFTTLGLLTLVAMCTQLGTFALHTATLSGQGSAAATSARLLGVTHRQITIWRLVLLTVGSILFAVYAFQLSTLSIWVILAFGLVLFSEVMGRFLFYESYVRVGL